MGQASRPAFDLIKEPPEVKRRYGEQTNFLLARRLVEAGVPRVYFSDGPDWDDHDKISPALRRKLPPLDLAERGLDKHVTILLWGEMGRLPKIGTETGRPTGRDHVYYQKGSKGMPVVIFCHGLGGGKEQYAKQMQDLAARHVRGDR